MNKIRASAGKFLPQKLRRPLVRVGADLALTGPAYAQQGGNDPWDNAVNVLKTALTGAIASGLSLVAIVVGGRMFAFGEGQSKRVFAGIVFGIGLAVGAVNFTAGHFPGG